jgi:hypothetical protein
MSQRIDVRRPATVLLAALFAGNGMLSGCSNVVQPHGTSQGGSGTGGGSMKNDGGDDAGTDGGSMKGDAGHDAGPPCGPAGMPCGDGEYCYYADGSCGASGVSNGACVTQPRSCSDGAMVCGCDGRVYYGPVCAAVAGVNLGDSKICEFTCGGSSCEKMDSYCSTTGSGSPLCLTLPTSCWNNPSCTACFSDPKCTCSGDNTTGITVTCP